MTLTDSALALLPQRASYVHQDSTMTIMVVRNEDGISVKAVANDAMCNENTRFRISQADTTQHISATAQTQLNDEAASSDIKRNRGHPEITASIAVVIAAIVGWVIKKKMT